MTGPEPSRPRPPRPEVNFEPMRERSEPDNTRRSTTATTAWTLAGLMILGLALVVAFYWDSVLIAVEVSVAQQDPNATESVVRDAAVATLFSSGAAAAVLLVIAAVALRLIRGGTPSAKFLVAAVGALTVAAAVTFNTFMGETGHILGGLLQWGPFAAAGAAVVGTVAALVIRD